MATQKCPRCDQNGAKGNGNDLNVYVNGSVIVPHAFRIARIPTPSGGGHAVSFSMRILRFFFFWPLLVPVFWRKAALPKSPGLHAGDIQGPPKRQRGFFYGLALDPFVSVHGKTQVQGTPVFAVPADDVRWALRCSQRAPGKLGCHDGRVVASRASFLEPRTRGSVGSKYDQTKKRNPLDRPHGERLHWNCGSRLARARRDKGIHAPADSASCATDRLYPQSGGACFIGC